MSFLEGIVDVIMAPVNFVRSKVMGVENVQGKIKIDVSRIKQSVEQVKGMPGELKDKAAEAQDAVAKATKDPLSSDPQLSAALLMLRMQLAGAQL